MTHSFLVCNVSVPIIGADLLYDNHIVVDLRNQILSKGAAQCNLVSQIGSKMTINPASEPVTPEVIRKSFPALLHTSLSNTPLHGVEHSIETQGPPVYSKPRRVSPEKAQIIREYVEESLKNGILRSSKSPWSSPLHLVPKKTGGWRVCGDYRRLNGVTVPDRYPLRLIDDLLSMASGKSCGWVFHFR